MHALMPGCCHRARSSIKDLKEQLNARLVEDIFRNHRLLFQGSPRLPAMLSPDSELDLERQLRFAVQMECAEPERPREPLDSLAVYRQIN